MAGASERQKHFDANSLDCRRKETLPCEKLCPEEMKSCPTALQRDIDAQPVILFQISELTRNNLHCWPEIILFQGSQKAMLEQPGSERSSPTREREKMSAAVGDDESVPATNDWPHRQTGNGSAAALLQLWTRFFRAEREWAQNYAKQQFTLPAPSSSRALLRYNCRKGRKIIKIKIMPFPRRWLTLLFYSKWFNQLWSPTYGFPSKTRFEVDPSLRADTAALCCSLIQWVSHQHSITRTHEGRMVSTTQSTHQDTVQSISALPRHTERRKVKNKQTGPVISYWLLIKRICKDNSSGWNACCCLKITSCSP